MNNVVALARRTRLLAFDFYNTHVPFKFVQYKKSRTRRSFLLSS